MSCEFYKSNGTRLNESNQEYLTLCDTCIYLDNNLDCKVAGRNNKTALVHEPVQGVGRKRVFR